MKEQWHSQMLKVFQVLHEELEEIGNYPKGHSNWLDNRIAIKEEQTIRLISKVKQALDLPEHEGHEYQPTYEH